LTPKTYAKIKALADDPSCDPATREIARKKLAAYTPPSPRPITSIHPGLQQSEEYRKWKSINRKQNPFKE
jgi:hypothetical protein